MGAEQNFEQDLDLTDAEARGVKGGVLPVEGGDAGSGSSGFSLGGARWKMRRAKRKKKKSTSKGSSAGGRPV